jgi:hypothetical protein
MIASVARDGVLAAARLQVEKTGEGLAEKSYCVAMKER